MSAFPPTQHPGRTNLEVAEALRVFNESPKEMRPVYDEWLKCNVSKPFIFHDGKWKRICRTDDCDDVATSGGDETFEIYLAKIRLGARFDDRLFSCIDSHTDG
ncbi:MAG: hypothetical protein NUV34_01115 [Sulfuricaulis sp.]|nr:hypothetical protein [Sulfuricaulis sp.]